MNVADVMSRTPQTVRTVDRLDAAARVLWESDCGFVPVVDQKGALVGVLTDRDLCMASYTQGKPLSDLPVRAVMVRDVSTCAPDDDLKDAMQVMAARQVHRLPVLDVHGALVGVLASNDLLQLAKVRPTAVPTRLLVDTLAAIAAPRGGGRDFQAAGRGGGKAANKAANKVKKKTAKVAKKAKVAKTSRRGRKA